MSRLVALVYACITGAAALGLFVYGKWLWLIDKNGNFYISWSVIAAFTVIGFLATALFGGPRR